MRILTLIENTSASDKLYKEHGLSFYVEHNGNRILLDTGASDKFMKNASRMLVDLNRVHAVVLSHNHMDHAGGLEALLKVNPNMQVYAKKSVLGEYSKQVGLFKLQIGLGESFFVRHAKQFVLFKQFQEVTEGIYLLSCEIDEEQYRTKDKTLLMKENGKWVADTFQHELFMVVFPTNKIEDGCVILSSCSHCGIVNIVKTVQQNWPEVQIHGIVGGFHLAGRTRKPVDKAYAEHIADALKALHVGPIYTCHCTGLKGYEALKFHLGDQIQYLQTGEELEF